MSEDYAPIEPDPLWDAVKERTDGMTYAEVIALYRRWQGDEAVAAYCRTEMQYAYEDIAPLLGLKPSEIP